MNEELVEPKQVLQKGNLGLIVNESDQSVVRIEIYDINKDDLTIWARLYDLEDVLITGKRVYSYEGDYKNIPCELTESDLTFFDPIEVELSEIVQ